MSGILFFIFASCEPLIQICIEVKQGEILRSEIFIYIFRKLHIIHTLHKMGSQSESSRCAECIENISCTPSEVLPNA